MNSTSSLAFCGKILPCGHFCTGRLTLFIAPARIAYKCDTCGGFSDIHIADPHLLEERTPEAPQ
jgi:hypothetical protein